MKIEVIKTDLAEIQPLRALLMQAMNVQIRYNACHERGWSDSYILRSGKNAIGYGSVKGKDNLKDRDTVFEFYLIPDHQKLAAAIFPELITASKARYIECQSNDPFLSSMLYEFSKNINSDVILFGDSYQTSFDLPEVTFRLSQESDKIFDHEVEPVGEYVLQKSGEVIATGGFALHYNIPFADLYMEVKKEYRQQGYGCFLLQELKKECYNSGRVPAARCSIKNIASRSALLKSGLKISGFMLMGTVL